MNSQPLVSVVVIFLNAGRFLQEALDSVFAQTYPAWELLLVDDGSTDESANLAQRCAAQHPDRVRYLQHPGHANRGMSASRNLGIANARGEFIALLDADDAWTPYKLERQAALLEAHPQAVMVYGPAQWWYSWTGDSQDVARDFIHPLGVPANTLLKPPTLLARFLRQEGISPCTCSVLMRREAVAAVGGFEEVFRGLYEDQAFFAKLSLSGPVYVDSHCSARYRQHPASSYAQNLGSAQYRSARRAFLDWLGVYLAKRGERRGEVLNPLRIEQAACRYPALPRLAQRLRDGLPGRAMRLARRLCLRLPALPVLRQLRMLQLRRLQPLGGGRQEGTPVVRWYWEDFLQRHRRDLRGRALEVGETATIRRVGGAALTRAEAIDLAPHSPEVSLVADLSRADTVPDCTYDSFLVQFTMHLIYDVEAALYHAIRILQPGGVLLVNFPCVDYYFPYGLDMGTGEPLFLYHWYTPIEVENMLRRCGLGESDYELQVYGNLFTRLAYQANLPAEQLTRRELEHSDPGHPLLICARVVKPGGWKAEKPAYRDPWKPDTAPAQWNPVRGHYG